MRLYLIIAFSIVDQSMFFFTCKNALLLVLQFYRLFVVISESSKSYKKNLAAARANEDVEQGVASPNTPRTNGKHPVGNGSVHTIELDAITELPADGLAHR